MRKLLTYNKRRILVIIAVLILFAVGALVISQTIYVNNAHKTFENYYAFRGCTKLLTKTATDATCQLQNGQVIKMVLYQNKWYLNGDLPNCWIGNHLCF